MAMRVIFQSGLLAAVLLFSQPLLLWAQNNGPSAGAMPAGSALALRRGWMERAVTQELARLTLSATAMSDLQHAQQPGPRRRSWIGRHPVLFGTFVGFGGGFLIGYLPGRDAVFEDSDAAFAGWVLSGVGAGTGAVVGAIVGAVTK
jgi:hypothetical protein